MNLHHLQRSIRLLAVIPMISLTAALPDNLEGATDPRISQIVPPQFGSSGSAGRVIDMEGDGDMDLLGGSASGSVWVENLGSRTFSEPKMFRYDRTVQDSLFGDLDGDGRVDALQIGNHGGSEVLRPVHVSLSSQSLLEKARFDLGITAGSFQIVNLLGDGRMEIIRMDADDQSLTIGALLTNGSIGVLAGPYTFPKGVKASYAKAVDVDGDGDLDLHVGAWILERTGPQTFAHQLHPAAKPAYDSDNDIEAKWADLDGDGLQDIFTFRDAELKWAKNSGAFSFVERPQLAIEGEFLSVVNIPSSGAILTISQAVTKHDTIEWHIKKVLASGVVLSDRLIDSTPHYASSMLACDLDKDGHTDIFRAMGVFPNFSYQQNYSYWPSVAWGNVAAFDALDRIVEAPLSGRAISAFADFDGDEDKDFVVGPDVLGRFALWANDGLGHFSRARHLTEILSAEFIAIGASVTSIESGDVDADGDTDLAVTLTRKPPTGLSQNLTYFARNSGSGIFSIPEDFPVGTFDFITGGNAGGSLYDWDGDGDLDFVGGAWQENKGGVLSQSATPLLSAASGSDALGNPMTLASFRAGDLDGDGRSDIISEGFNVTLNPYGGVESSTIGIGFSDEFGVVEEVSEVPIQIYGADLLGNPTMSGGTAIIDVNLDGHNDLVYTCITGYDTLGYVSVSSFWRRNPGNGSRLVENWITLPLSMSLPYSKAGDFDGDGVADYTNGTAFLAPRRSGPLISPTYDFTGGLFGWRQTIVAHVSDLDGDGDEDLVVRRDGEFNLVRNLIIDERSKVAARMRADGVLGPLANPDEDADGDGRNNALELLQGTDPKLPDAADPERSQPSLVVGEESVAIRYENRADAEDLDLTYDLECSENLRDWVPMANAATTQNVLPHGWQQTTLQQTPTKPRCFYRVQMKHEVYMEK